MFGRFYLYSEVILLRRSNSHHVTDTGDEFSEVLPIPIHRDQDHAYGPGSRGAIVDLFWVCLSRRTSVAEGIYNLL